MTVNLLYEQQLSDGTVLSNFSKNESRLLSFLKLSNYNYNIYFQDDFPQDTKNFVPYEFFNENLPVNIKAEKEKSNLYPKLKSTDEILVWWAHEGTLTKIEILDTLHKEFPNNKIKFVTCNNNLQPKYAKSRSNWLTMKSCNYWWHHIKIHKEKLPKLSKDKVATKSFSFYNRFFRMYRAWCFHDLLKDGLLTNADFTYGNLNKPKKLSQQEDKFNSFCDDAQLDKINFESLPSDFVEFLSNDFVRGNTAKINYYDSVLHQNSYLDLVSEGTIALNSSYITEKTYRAIGFGNLFLILGEPHSLKFLREKGFKTFENIFDESYDNEINFFKRWNIIKKNIEWWVSLGAKKQRKIYLENFDKLIYNRNVLLKTDLTKEIDNIFL